MSRTRIVDGRIDALAIRAEELDTALVLIGDAPLRSLEIVGPWSGEQLARLPVVEELIAHELDDDGLRAVFAAPVARTLIALDLAGSHVIEFRPGASLPACRRLSLAGTDIEIDDWAHAHQLRELDISLPRDGSRRAENYVAFATPPEMRTVRKDD